MRNAAHKHMLPNIEGLRINKELQHQKEKKLKSQKERAQTRRRRKSNLRKMKITQQTTSKKLVLSSKTGKQ